MIKEHPEAAQTRTGHVWSGGSETRTAMELPCTLVTPAMDTEREDKSVDLLKTSVSLSSKRHIKNNITPGFVDGVDRTFKHKAQPGTKSKKKTYAQVKPYFAY